MRVMCRSVGVTLIIASVLATISLWPRWTAIAFGVGLLVIAVPYLWEGWWRNAD